MQIPFQTMVLINCKFLQYCKACFEHPNLVLFRASFEECMHACNIHSIGRFELISLVLCYYCINCLLHLFLCWLQSY